MSVDPIPAAIPAVAALAGYTVGVTAARRAEELGGMLERRGARIVYGPAIRIVPVADDQRLLAGTTALIVQQPDIAIATTGIGFRGWMEAAEGWGLGDSLLATLGSAELIARGPKARGAIKACGLDDAWSPASESSAEVLEHLLERGVEGRRIAIQLHGEPLPDVVEGLRMAGADVVTLPVYRWEPPVSPAPLDRLTDAVLAGEIDVLTFTSAPAAASVLARAKERGLYDKLLDVLRGQVMVMCVGPVTAGPLEDLDIPTHQPVRSRLGAMVRALEAEAPGLSRPLPVAGHWLELRGYAVVLDGELKPVPPAAMAVLRRLTHPPGRVVTRGQLLGVLPGRGNDEHAVDTAMTRLRSALGVPGIVQTVVKRGYRLALEPRAADARGHCGNGD